MRFLLHFSIVLWLLMISSCREQTNDESLPLKANSDLKSILIAEDIYYEENISADSNSSLRLDLALPESYKLKRNPAIVIIHGGGWRAGSKTDPIYRSMMVNYALLGYVTISVEYRLHQAAPFPACIEDVKCAVRWLKAHADQYQVDTTRIGAYGHSAGAHLALMLAMSEGNTAFNGSGGWNQFTSKIKAVAGGSTPTVWNENIKQWANPKWWPIGYINKDVPPMLLIHGTNDQIVKIEDTDRFVNKMDSVGAAIEYLRIDGADHGLAYLGKLEITNPALEEFFKNQLKP